VAFFIRLGNGAAGMCGSDTMIEDASGPPRSGPPAGTVLLPMAEGYVVHEFLGRGSAGMVWRATQEGTLREVALKFPAGWALRFAWEGGTTVREGSGDCSGAGPCECGGGLWHGGGDGRPLAGHGMSFTGGASHGLAVIKVARGDVIWSI